MKNFIISLIKPDVRNFNKDSFIYAVQELSKWSDPQPAFDFTYGYINQLLWDQQF